MYGDTYPFSLVVRRVLVGLLLGLVGAASVHTNAVIFSQSLTQASEKEAIRERISAIIRENIRRGEGTTIDGIKFWTRVPPTSDKIPEIKSYGDTGVQVLEEFMWSSGDSREGDLAIRILGLLGGGRIVEPLKQVVEKSDSPGRRELALRWLTQAPWDLAAPVIRVAAETDPDPRVREVARDLLVNYSPQRLVVQP